MKKPTLEEVKEHFKDAKYVEDNNGDIIDLTDIGVIIEEEGRAWYASKNGKNDVRLYHQNPDIQDGYAEIIEYKNKPMKKVIRLDEPKEEKQPKPIELTHFCTPRDGWKLMSNEPRYFDKIVYLGYCGQEKTDKFICYHPENNAIEFWKGHLNDGVY